MLCNRHIFVEVAPNVFRNNRHSYELRKETGAADMVLIEYLPIPTTLTIVPSKRINAAKHGSTQ
jgi:hypothetical protein